MMLDSKTNLYCVFKYVSYILQACCHRRLSNAMSINAPPALLPWFVALPFPRPGVHALSVPLACSLISLIVVVPGLLARCDIT